MGFRLKGSTASSTKSSDKPLLVEFCEAALQETNNYQTLEEGQADLLGCLDAIEEDGTKLPSKMKIVRKRIEEMDSLPNLVSYMYNLYLSTQGLSVR